MKTTESRQREDNKSKPSNSYRKIFNFNTPERSDSQQSIATSGSFAAASESVPPATPAASFFADPEAGETMTSESTKIPPVIATAVPPDVDLKSTVPAPITPDPAPAMTAEEPAAATSTEAEEESKFDVAQNVYGTAKNVWAWGKTIPVISNLLGITEAVAAKALDTTIHMDLPAVDQEGVTPQLKRLDDVVVTPAILAAWKIIGPAVSKGEELVVKPILTGVVSRVLAPLGMSRDNSKEREMQNKEEKKKAMIDTSPTPEIVPSM